MSKETKSDLPREVALTRLSQQCHCTTPFHVVRMRFWGEIISPPASASALKSINRLWWSEKPIFHTPGDASVLFRSLADLWNDLAEYQTGTPPFRLYKLAPPDTSEALRLAARTRTEGLYSGFLHGFAAGNYQITVPALISALLTELEKAMDAFATMERVLARASKPQDVEWYEDFRLLFPELDRVVESNLNEIAAFAIRLRNHEIRGSSG